MVSHVKSFVFQGVDVEEIDVQVHLAPGLPAFTVVGMADKSVTEARERVRAALNAIGLALPAKRITVNLSPADLTKEGSHFDLAIALGLLSEMQVIEATQLEDYFVLGELSLGGNVMPVNGIIPAAIFAKAKGRNLICPRKNSSEATWAGDDIEIIAPDNLLQLVNHFGGRQLISPPDKADVSENPLKDYPDMSEIVGQETAKRALEIAAAGGHNILMVGPPGSGKSMLARALKGILPPMSSKEILEVSMINSIIGNIVDGKLSTTRPYRDPHHSCSMAAMVGGGMKAKPGEATLSHCGILFLDELPEFPRSVLDSLRQPLENGEVTVARVNAHVTYPASFQLVAAMNPCRCGYLGDAIKACNKAPRCADDYQSKLSGPFLDRIDINIEVPAVEVSHIMQPTASSESTSSIAARVNNARRIQRERFANDNISMNSEAEGDLLNKAVTLDSESRSLVTAAVEKMGLSMRAYNKVLKVARTIADLENAENVSKLHIAEAINYQRRN